MIDIIFGLSEDANPNDITIHVKKPVDWSGVYIHYWGVGPYNNQQSDWYNCPSLNDEGNGWYKYVFTNEDEANFLFKNVSGHANPPYKTPDLNSSTFDHEGWCFNDNGTWRCQSTNPDEVTGVIVHFKKPADWAGAYIHIWNVSNPTNWNSCPAMDDEEDGWYSYQINNENEASLLFKSQSGHVSFPYKTVDLNTSEIDTEGWYMDGAWYTSKPENNSTNVFEEGSNKAVVSIQNKDTDTRTYIHSTNISLRDNFPSSKQVIYTEQANQPIIRTNNDMFDALYALAIDEARQNHREYINDSAFNNNGNIACSCFETGRKWHYVWTRDISYSVHLGLASVNPTRSKNSLLFKLSPLKAGGGDQIVQDTGSGGSYPISTDRVVWAIAAYELLKYLDGSERTTFRNTAYTAIKNTIEHDRKVVYDADDGLYTGEQSFLDWREQSYPTWTEFDTIYIGMSKALSTNIAHYQILCIAAALAAEKGLTSEQAQYQSWADALKITINNKFYINTEGLYSTILVKDLVQTQMKKYDLLGESFAVIFDIADTTKATSVVQNYPHTNVGPPVMHPQHLHHFVYHNRAIWPFVTAYWLKAAAKVHNSNVVNHGIYSMIRGATLNLSNMENFEFLTGNNDKTNINSQRQLWSVAGYISMVQDIIFGLDVSQSGIRFLPFITKKIRNTTFAGGDSIILKHFNYKGKSINVNVQLPAVDSNNDGYYSISLVTLNGISVGTGYINASSLTTTNNIVVTLVTNSSSAGIINIITNNNSPAHWAPKEPEISGIGLNRGKIRVTIDTRGETGVSFNIFRDGVLYVTNHSSTSWTDQNSTDYNQHTYCYSVQSVNASGNVSFPSRTVCYWGSGGRIQIVDASQFVNGSGEWIYNHGRWHYQNWGDRSHTLEITSFTPNRTGTYLLQLVYGNGSGHEGTGITCAVKKVRIEEVSTGNLIAEGRIQMPQLGKDGTDRSMWWQRWNESSSLAATLDATKHYRIIISEDSYAINMSFFDHFKIYTGNNSIGGGAYPYNYVNIAEVKFLFMQ